MAAANRSQYNQTPAIALGELSNSLERTNLAGMGFHICGFISSLRG